jgi:O-antigen/teichoic acid export membrane protein
MARIQVVQNVVSLAIVFTLPLLKFYGLCARSAIPSALGVWLYHRKRPLRIACRFDARALKDVIKVGLPFSLWGSLDTSLWVATESALILYFAGTRALGLFAVAVAIREVLVVLPQAVHQVLAPRLVESFAREGNSRKTNSKTMLLSLALAGLMTAVVLVITLTLDWLVPRVIPMYAAGIPLIKLCLWFCVVAAATIPSATLFAAGRPWLFGSGVLIGFAVFPIAAYLLVPFLGGAVAVVAGSLIGRTARVLTAYVEIVLLLR